MPMVVDAEVGCIEAAADHAQRKAAANSLGSRDVLAVPNAGWRCESTPSCPSAPNKKHRPVSRVPSWTGPVAEEIGPRGQRRAGGELGLPTGVGPPGVPRPPEARPPGHPGIWPPAIPADLPIHLLDDDEADGDR